MDSGSTSFCGVKEADEAAKTNEVTEADEAMEEYDMYGEGLRCDGGWRYGGG